MNLHEGVHVCTYGIVGSEERHLGAFFADEYRRPKHPDIEDYMRRYISNDQDWEQVDDEDCSPRGVNYTGPTARIKGKIEATLHSWGGTITEPNQEASTKPTPDRERFSVPHASRSRIL